MEKSNELEKQTENETNIKRPSAVVDLIAGKNISPDENKIVADYILRLESGYRR